MGQTHQPGPTSPRGEAAPPTTGAARRQDDETVVSLRSEDDRDLGWGDGADDNDERLLRERPPHW